jgi:hypothetical protein
MEDAADRMVLGKYVVVRGYKHWPTALTTKRVSIFSWSMVIFWDSQ